MDVQDRIPAKELNELAPAAPMSKRIKINSVSDVSCPWCVIGLKSLAEALRLVSSEVTADMHFPPFELNLQMDAAGEDKAEHLG